MIEISAQAAIVDQAIKRLPMKKEQRDALVAARDTLKKLDLLRAKLINAAPNDPGDDIALELFDLLGLEAVPVVRAYGDRKHAPVPQS
jgi:hypothetical protein